MREAFARIVRRLRRDRAAMLGASLLMLLMVAALLAPFLAPYGETESDRACFRHPPTPLHWREPSGRWHLTPFVHATRPSESDPTGFVVDRGSVVPVRVFVTGTPYRVFGRWVCDRHLVGVAPGAHLFLCGADALGRDVFSRLLFGARVTLGVACIGMLLTCLIGTLLGAVSGLYGGWVDALVMRTSEVLMAVPRLKSAPCQRISPQITREVLPLSLQVRAVTREPTWAQASMISACLSVRLIPSTTRQNPLGLARIRF